MLYDNVFSFNVIFEFVTPFRNCMQYDLIIVSGVLKPRITLNTKLKKTVIHVSTESEPRSHVSLGLMVIENLYIPVH